MTDDSRQTTYWFVHLRYRVLTPIIVFLVLSNIIWAQNPLKIYCIDVEQASSTLIISPTNKYVLIDAGFTNYGYSTVFPFLQSLGITHLDYTIATHYHEDHIGGLDEVIYALSGNTSNDSIINWCYDRGDSNNPTNTIFNGYAAAAGSKRRIIGLGETLNLGGGAFMFCVARNGRVVNGTSVTPSSGENYRSIACVLQYGYFRLFIGGDLTGIAVSGDPDVETKVAPVVRNVDVYVVNHHGSRNSSNTVFLDSLRSEVAIISQGTTYDHPHQEALDRLAARNAYIYQMNANPSGGTIPIGSGRVLNTTAAISVNNYEYIINGDTYLIGGVRRDGSVLEILEPRDTIAEGTVVVPKAKVKNLGNVTESFTIRFKIGSGYNRTKTVSGLVPNDTVTVVFETIWTALRGNYQVTCSTEVPGDSSSGNDRKLASLTIAFFDAELKEIISPTVNDTFFTNESVTPKVVIKDNSQFSNPTTVKVYCQISSVLFYLDSVQTTLYPGASDTIVFTKKSLAGLINSVYSCSAWVKRFPDCNLSNNFKSVHFVISVPSIVMWEQLSPLLLEVKGVKDGGCLVSTENRIYAFKGNNTNEFYSFDPASNSWQRKCSLPYGTYLNLPLKRRVKKGGALTYGENSIGDHVIYALKGNNTQQFWQYSIQTDEWIQLADVPGSKIKAGSGLAYVSFAPDSKYVYCLKGSDKSYQFLAYDVIRSQWTQRKESPYGLNNKPFKDGSCIIAVGENIYALKGGARYNEFYCYDVNLNNWYEVESIPQYHTMIGKRKKVKNGGSLAYEPITHKIYAFKGGGTKEFWCYDINVRMWTAIETIPLGVLGKKGSIGTGAGLATFAGEVYALKGNNSKEFWRYIPNDYAKRFRISYQQTYANTPLPHQNSANPNYKFHSATIKIFNISGQLIKTEQIKNYSHQFLSNFFKAMRPGVYFIQITSLENLSTQRKITEKLTIIH